MLPSLFFSVFLSVLSVLIEFVNPFLIRYFIEWFQEDNPAFYTGLLLAFGIGSVSFVKSYLFRACSYYLVSN